MTAANPLTKLTEARGGLPFDQMGAEHVEPAAEQLLAEARATLDTIGQDTSPPTWDSVYEALELATRPLELAYSVMSHLESVRTTPELREAFNKVKPELSAFFASIPLDPKLYARLKALANTEEAKHYPPDRARGLAQTLDDFERHGAALGAEDKKKLEALSRELATVTAKYGQNILDATAAWTKLVTDESKLAGLPEFAVGAAKAAAEAKGQQGWLLTLQAPSLIPTLTYLDDAEIREEVYRAYHARAASGERDNTGLVTEILRLRKSQAALLGYDNFADFVLEPRMAKSAAEARRFVDDLTARTRPAFEQETAELQAFRRQLEGEDAPELKPWDVSYYAEKLRKDRFAFDEEALRPYFEVSRVMQGLFTIAERLYGLSIEETSELSVWHPEVRTYRVKEEGELVGHFYVDLHPRDDKRGGAWMHGLDAGVLRDGQLDRPHLGLFAANVTAPRDGHPTLLSHDEALTLFHEFGHLLHHLLSKVEIHGQAGTRVAWDFVELPSQIMENWCWSREALDLFARHHETDAPIPDELFEKMTKARTFRAASGMMRQLGFATVDLSLHLDFDPESGASPVAHARTVLEQFSPVGYYDGWAFINGFSHLFSSAVGYASGYYSYKWAEVLDADAFSKFEAAGVFDPKVGAAFRDEVLAKGDSAPPEVLFERFMGRGPQLDALLERSGLSAPA